jgi:hypothetical protein
MDHLPLLAALTAPSFNCVDTLSEAHNTLCLDPDFHGPSHLHGTSKIVGLSAPLSAIRV